MLPHTCAVKKAFPTLTMFWAVALVLGVIPGVHGQTRDPGPPSNAMPPSLRCSLPSVDGELREIPERWKTAYNHGDAAGVAALYSEDAYYLTQHFISGVLHGRSEIQAYVQKGVDAKYHIDSIEVLATQCSGDLAYAITRYKSTNAGRNDIGVNLVVLRKREGHWWIVAHEAAVPDPASAVRSLKGQ